MVRRKVIDEGTKQVLSDHAIIPGQPQHKSIDRLLRRHDHVRVEFLYRGEPVSDGGLHLTAHQSRQLDKKAKACHSVLTASSKGRCAVMEVFSPPRFSLEVQKRGLKGRSYDLVNGFDFRRTADRQLVEADLRQDPPELLVLCPPCTDEGGWFNLNSSKWSQLEVLRRKAVSRSYIRWCCKLFRIGVEVGCRVLFEHPTGARTWSYAEMQSLCRKFFTTKLHMCRYGMKLPESERFIRKSTRLLVSHEDMCELGLLCHRSGDHACHDVIAGGAPGVSSISAYAGAYPVKFVQAVLKHVPSMSDHRIREHHNVSWKSLMTWCRLTSGQKSSP